MLIIAKAMSLVVGWCTSAKHQLLAAVKNFAGNLVEFNTSRDRMKMFFWRAEVRQCNKSFQKKK